MSSLSGQKPTPLRIVVPPPRWSGGYIALQPIVSLSGARPVHGFEALARPAAVDVEQLLADAFAAGARELYALEASLLRATLPLARHLPGRSKLFVNVHPSTFEHDRFATLFLGLAATAGVDVRRIVVEITEHSAFLRPPRALANAAQLRACGIDLALDDVATTCEHLEHAAALEPSYLKVGRDVGTNFERDPLKTAIVQSVGRLAGASGARLIVEGIESAATVSAARRLGVTLGQGYHFARPRAPQELFEQYTAAAAN